MKLNTPPDTSRSLRLLIKVWFGLTSNERLALLVVLGLFLLGLSARYWHLRCEHSRDYQPPSGMFTK